MTAAARTFTRWIGALLLGALLLPGCASEEERFETHRAQAGAYAEAGDFRSAEIELRNALKLNPTSAPANFQLAEILMKRQAHLDAIFYYEEAFRLDPEEPDSALSAAQLLAGTDLDRAKELVETVLERHPTNPVAYARRAGIKLIEVDTEAALAAALTAVELGPEEPDAWLMLGRVHQARAREKRLTGERLESELFEEAIAAFERGAKLTGPGGIHSLERARTLSSWPERRGEAEAAYREVLESATDPGVRATAARQLIEYAEARGDTELIRYALEMVVSYDKANLNAWEELAHLADSSEAGQGKQVFARLLEQRPDDPKAHARYALYLDRSGQREEALEQIESSLERLPDSPVLLSTLMDLQDAAGDPEAAEATFHRLEVAHPDHPLTITANARRAIYEARFEDAAMLLRALTEDVESERAFFLLALSELRLGNLPQAEEAIRQARRLTKRFDPALAHLHAEIRYRARDWRRVIRTLGALNKRGYPVSRRERIWLARSQYQIGRPEAGRTILEELLAEERPPLSAVLEFVRREQVNRPDQAREILTQTLEQHPGHPRLLRSLVAMEVRQGRREEALRAVDAAVEANPEDPQLRLLRAEMLVALGDLDRAAEDAQWSLDRNPGSRRARNLLMSIYASQNRIEKFAESLEESYRAGTLDAQGMLLLASVQNRLGNEQRAIELLESALSSNPDLAFAKNDLAYLLAKRGTDLDRAISLATDAVARMPESFAAADTLGFAYFQKGLLEPALSQFDAALALVPEDEPGHALIYHHRGLALAKLGRSEEAEGMFEKARSLDPELEVDVPRTDAENAAEQESSRASQP